MGSTPGMCAFSPLVSQWGMDATQGVDAKSWNVTLCTSKSKRGRVRPGRAPLRRSRSRCNLSAGTHMRSRHKVHQEVGGMLRFTCLPMSASNWPQMLHPMGRGPCPRESRRPADLGVSAAPPECRAGPPESKPKGPGKKPGSGPLHYSGLPVGRSFKVFEISLRMSICSSSYLNRSRV